MAASSVGFSLPVEGIEGTCPAGEASAKQNITALKIPVFARDGPCIRGDIMRLASNIVSQEFPSVARRCRMETSLLPRSAMARRASSGERAVMIEGWFLKRHGQVSKNLQAVAVAEEGADKIMTWLESRTEIP